MIIVTREQQKARIDSHIEVLISAYNEVYGVLLEQLNGGVATVIKSLKEQCQRLARCILDSIKEKNAIK